MASVASKLFSDDVSLVVILLDTNPYFWSSSSSISFPLFFSHVLSFVNSILLLNQLNQVVIIATGHNSCDYIFDSSALSSPSASQTTGNVRMPRFCEELVKNLSGFLSADEKLSSVDAVNGVGSSRFCRVRFPWQCAIYSVLRDQGRFIRSQDYSYKCMTLSDVVVLLGCFFTLPINTLSDVVANAILCLHGSPDGPEQYVSVMNAIFSAQRSMASYITGGVYSKPKELDGLFQYLSTVFATDLHSRNFIELPKIAGVDFRASCFCHKSTIDMGFICSVCLSIFCTDQKKCSTCGSLFGRAKSDASSGGQKRKAAS